jgi:diaminohydroxyphosphoribosylaminopyrimidine deaminase/5-amino-6-(5-phosphoribosylamino)uracil reductase
VVATARESARRRGDAFRRAGWEIWEFPARGGHVPLSLLLARAAREGFLRVLAEAGPGLAGALLEADLVDEISLYLAPAVLGGEAVWPPATAPRRGTRRGRPERRFEYVDQRLLGEDLWVRLRRRGRIERLGNRIEAADRRGRRRPA